MITASSAHYLIFHPARTSVKVRAKAITGVGVVNYANNIFVDPPTACTGTAIGCNEDPYVFSDPWLYSFCHATQLRRISKKHQNVGAGSVLIFAEDCKESDTIYVDTVIVVENSFPWPTPGATPPRGLTSRSSLPVQKHPHWRGGLKQTLGKGHNGSITYTARSFSAGAGSLGSYSFLPITEAFERVPVCLASMQTTLSQKIRARWKGRYPVLLDSKEACSLITEIDNSAAFKVVSPIKKGKVGATVSACQRAVVRPSEGVMP